MKLSVFLLVACVVVIASAATETGPDALKRDKRLLGAGKFDFHQIEIKNIIGCHKNIGIIITQVYKKSSVFGMGPIISYIFR